MDPLDPLQEGVCVEADKAVFRLKAKEQLVKLDIQIREGDILYGRETIAQDNPQGAQHLA